ncbi:MAG: biotin synthase BioB [Pseudomonadota bacterium]
MSLNAAYRKVLDGRSLSDADIRFLVELPNERVLELTRFAHTLRLDRFGDRVELCAIVNAKSGGCTEDCAFCAQSARSRADSPRHGLLAAGEIEAAARAAGAHGAARFGIVASGKDVGAKDFEGFVEAVGRVAGLGLAPDLSPGVLDQAQLKTLKKAGLKGYHHNLETSASFFPSICTTHGYDEDVRAVRAGLEAGLRVCSGGIFGLGEGWDDRVELALLLASLGVDSVPINFLQPIPGTPLAGREVLAPVEALKVIGLYRFLLPDAAIRLCGGRLSVFGPDAGRDVLGSGASGLMIGDYLTVRGGDVDRDLADIRAAGLRPEPHALDN